MTEEKTEPTTESLLNNLIAECHGLIREMVRPHAEAVDDTHDRIRYLEAAAQLVKISARTGDTIARLRQPAVTERRQRIVVERIETVSLPPSGSTGTHNFEPGRAIQQKAERGE